MKQSILCLAMTAALCAQPPAPRGPQGPTVISPEVSADRRITFRVLAPKAESVRVMGGDIPDNGKGATMTKAENGVWETTVGPVPAGSYRYNFNIDGLTLVDPRNPSTSESLTNVWSLVNVAGSESFDTRDVPHGAVAAVTYYSSALQRSRRMTIYTPAGYEMGKDKLPVFYLLHGSSDSDASWSSVGRAGFILDNLIAAKQAKPMIVVMPAGHTSTVRSQGVDPFLKEFNEDILPYVEKHYRVVADRAHRAIAGLSMGGNQTLNIALPHLNQFAYVGVYSSGLIRGFGAAQPGAASQPQPTAPTWEEQHMAELDDVGPKKGLKLFWFATGKEDGLLETTKKTVAMLEKHGFHPILKETSGGHTWLNWRDYLNEFAPKLFQ